jgi:hypothetical protein
MGGDVHVITLTAVWERSLEGGWLRSFGLPSGLGSGHRVQLLLAGAGEEPNVRLNGCPLGAAVRGADGRYAWDVTARLQRRNTLELPAKEPALPSATGGREPLPAVYGEVSLEIVDLSQVNNA